MRRNGRTEIRIEKEIREKVHVSVREQTVRARKKKLCTIFSSGFIGCVTNIIFIQHVQYTSENMEPVGLQFAVL